MSLADIVCVQAKVDAGSPRLTLADHCMEAKGDANRKHPTLAEHCVKTKVEAGIHA